MKPLSAFNFSRNNRKKLITSIITVLAAVAFLYLMQTFVRSMFMSIYQLNISSYKTHMRLLNIDSKKPIPEYILSKVKEDENVDRVVPFLTYGTKFTIPGSISDAAILGIQTKDMPYVMKKHKVKLLEGRLPNEGSQEVALDIKVALNKKVKIGDKIGNAVDKMDYLAGEYTVVGILESEDFISFLPYDIKGDLSPKDDMAMLRKSMLIFPKENMATEVDKLLSSFSKEEVKALTLSDAEKNFRDNTEVMRILDVISVMAIIVMVISVVSSKYVQFFNRRQELGILNAIGYTKLQIMKKTLLEITLANLIGSILGILLGILGSLALTSSVFASSGGIGVVFYYKAFLMAIFIPLFTEIFTLVPVNRMITRLDPINMIEGVI